jgi:hypothetical protein
MTAIGPGTIVQCIRWPSDDPFFIFHPEVVLTVSALYMVSLVVERPQEIAACIHCRTRSAGVKLVEKNQGVNYCLCLFRPFNDGDTSLVADETETYEEILKGPPVRVCEGV